MTPPPRKADDSRAPRSQGPDAARSRDNAAPRHAPATPPPQAHATRKPFAPVRRKLRTRLASLFVFLFVFVALVLLHLTLLRLPYYRDEAGYFIPAARDIYADASFIPHSTHANAHPPLVTAYLALAWRLFGFRIAVARVAMLAVAALALTGVFRLAERVANARVAAATILCTALYPVFFAQSSLAHLDMMAAALSMWGLVLYLPARALDETTRARADAAFPPDDATPSPPDSTSLLDETASLQGDTTPLQAGNTSLQTHTTSLQNETTLLQDGITSLQSEITSLQDDTTLLQDNTTSLQGENTLLQNNTTSLQSGDTSLQGDTTSLQDGNTLLQGDTTFLLRPATTLQDVTRTLQEGDTSLQDGAMMLGGGGERRRKPEKAQFRRVLCVFLFALAALAKETAVLVPLTLCVWELVCRLAVRSERAAAVVCLERRRSAWWTATLLLACVPLALWFAYHRARTGYTFGSPEYFRYNVESTLNLARMAGAGWGRLKHVTYHMNLWALTLAGAAAMLLRPRRDAGAERTRIDVPVQLVFAALILAHVVALSVVGGAAAARDMLPVLPLVVLIWVSTLWRRVPHWSLVVALVCVAFVYRSEVNPSYGFPWEENLAYRDFVLLHRDAAHFIAERYADARVLTSWPATDELTHADYGYTE
ncbi:MAG: hypothetical protein QOJ76_2372, partial [Acidobacteriota bacterium]|nr:hypothetical protein [Acidobacteriota bacterium]